MLPLPKIKNHLFSNPSLAFVAGLWLATVFTEPLFDYLTVSERPHGATSESVLLSLDNLRTIDPPARISIPSLSLETVFTTPVGVNAEGEMAVPEVYDQVAWYYHSPAPGEMGPAVVVGHVNSYRGKAVFDRLWDLRVGDLIIIESESGQMHEFQVTATRGFLQSEFPTELVYGDIDYRGLRLITCSGVFTETGERFTHNTVVFAELVSGEV